MTEPVLVEVLVAFDPAVIEVLVQDGPEIVEVQVPGQTGPTGPASTVPGPPGEGATDPGDLTLLFNNKLI